MMPSAQRDVTPRSWFNGYESRSLDHGEEATFAKSRRQSSEQIASKPRQADRLQTERVDVECERPARRVPRTRRSSGTVCPTSASEIPDLPEKVVGTTPSSLPKRVTWCVNLANGVALRPAKGWPSRANLWPSRANLDDLS